MANSFFNFVTRFISGTTVKAGPINDRLTDVQSGFGLVETAMKSTLRFAGFSSSTGTTATPNSLVQLNASGVPVASATLGFSPSFGGYRAQNVGAASVGTDAPNYGQMTSYVATIAFGSPNVLVVPAFAGNALKGVRLNAGATALEFGDQYGDAPIDDVTTLVGPAGVGLPAFYREGNNICRTPNTWTLENGAYMLAGQFDQAAQQVVGSSTGVARASLTRIATNLNESAIEVNQIGTYTLSFAANNTSAAGGFRVEIEWFNSSGVSIILLGKNFVGAISGNKRVYLTGNNSAFPCSFVVKVYELVGQQGDIRIADLKIESNGVPTPYNTHRVVELLSAQRGALSLVRNTIGPSNHVNLYTAPPAASGTYLYLRGTETGSHTSDVLIRCLGGTPGTDNFGELDFFAKYVRLGKLAGYAAVVDLGNTGAALSLTWQSNGAKQKATVNSNTTITMSAIDSTIVVDGLRLMLRKDATATTFTPTFASAATLKWKGNVIPEALTTASQEMEVIFWWDGARFVGSWAKI